MLCRSTIDTPWDRNRSLLQAANLISDFAYDTYVFSTVLVDTDKRPKAQGGAKHQFMNANQYCKLDLQDRNVVQIMYPFHTVSETYIMPYHQAHDQHPSLKREIQGKA